MKDFAFKPRITKPSRTNQQASHAPSPHASRRLTRHQRGTDLTRLRSQRLASAEPLRAC